MRVPERRRLPRTVSAALFIASLVLAACGEPSEDEQRETLADELVEATDGALDDEQATCVADGLHDAFDSDGLDRVVAVAAGDVDDDAVRTQVIDVFAACDALSRLVDP